MKKNTIIALVIVLIYCSFATYIMITEVGSHYPYAEQFFGDWVYYVLFPGFILGLFLGLSFGFPFLLLGQIITFLVLFFLFRIFLNWFTRKFKIIKP